MDEVFQYTCGSKYGTFRIMPMRKLGMLVWVTFLDEEEIATYLELFQAFEALIDAEEPWPSCGDFSSANLPEDPRQWFRKRLPLL